MQSSYPLSTTPHTTRRTQDRADGARGGCGKWSGVVLGWPVRVSMVSHHHAGRRLSRAGRGAHRPRRFDGRVTRVGGGDRETPHEAVWVRGPGGRARDVLRGTMVGGGGGRGRGPGAARCDGGHAPARLGSVQGGPRRARGCRMAAKRPCVIRTSGVASGGNFEFPPRRAGQTITSSAGRIAVAPNDATNGTGANPVGSPPGRVLKNRAFTAE